MQKQTLVTRANKVLSPVLGHYSELEVTHGEGCYLYGSDGKKYLDFAMGIATASTGHCHPKVVKAIQDQAAKLIHACAGVVYYEPNIALAEKLAEITPFEQAKTFFTNSGSEAVDGALKLARYVSKKPGLVSLKGGFHGRTFGALSLTTSKMKYQEGYAPLLPETYTVETIKELDELVSVQKKAIAAFILEPVQGEGGYTPVPSKVMEELRAYCTKHNILLILDEVQTGFGRTGKWFACEHSGVKPDILVLAKGIASGMPLGAIVAEASLMDQWSTGAHGGTYTGNPVSCAAALATIDVIAKELPTITERGESLLQKLSVVKTHCNASLPIMSVHGLGLMIGISFENAEIVKNVRKKCLEKGLILISCGLKDEVIRLCPPLNVTKIQIHEALTTLETILKESQ